MYKYYNIPDALILDNIIGESPAIKFSSVFNLNDPFEMKFNTTIDLSVVGHKAQFFKVHPDASYKEFEDWQKQVDNNDGFLWYIEQLQRNSIAQAITLCSFTENNTSNLMWSHYTKNHKGICVEYSPELIGYLQTIDGFFDYDKTKYSDSPPSIDCLESISSIVSKAMFNKQSEWKYEQEHRIIIESKENEYYIPFDPSYIKAVYVGAKAEDDIVSKVLNLCRPIDVDVFFGITLGRTYRVSFKKHKKGTIYSRSFWK